MSLQGQGRGRQTWKRLPAWALGDDVRLVGAGDGRQANVVDKMVVVSEMPFPVDWKAALLLQNKIDAQRGQGLKRLSGRSQKSGIHMPSPELFPESSHPDTD